MYFYYSLLFISAILVTSEIINVLSCGVQFAEADTKTFILSANNLVLTNELILYC